MFHSVCPHIESSGSWRGGEQGLQEEKGEGGRRKDEGREKRESTGKWG